MRSWFLPPDLPPGEVYWTSFRRVPRSSLGPDLSKIFVGAEGAFGG